MDDEMPFTYGEQFCHDVVGVYMTGGVCFMLCTI